MQEIWDLIVNNFVGCLLVMTRMSGIFTFNPIFGRSNVPLRVKTGMTLALSIFVISTMGGSTNFIPKSIPHFAFTIAGELLIGLIMGFLVNLILTVMIYAGELIDNQVGLGMAKAMDPSTGVTMPIFANIYYYLFILYFFISGGHLSYIKLFFLSYDILPIGFNFTAQTVTLAYTVAQYFATVITLAMKFAMPIIATELIVEFAIGVLMKAVPTIQVFVVNIQLKILIGLFVLIALAGPMSDFIEKLLDILWTNLYSSIELIGK